MVDCLSKDSKRNIICPPRVIIFGILKDSCQSKLPETSVRKSALFSQNILSRNRELLLTDEFFRCPVDAFL